MTETRLSEILEGSFVRSRDLEAPLADRLQAFANELRRLGPRFAAAIDALVSRLSESCMPERRRLRWASRCLRSCCRTTKDG